MAMPRKIRVEFGEVFPHGLYAVSEVTQVTDFEKSTQDKPVYATDEETGLLVWSVDVMDGDPEARKADRQFSVKLLAKQQPVLPNAPIPGMPFIPIELDGLTATPWVDSRTCTGPEKGRQHRCRARQGWSYRATGVKAPKNTPGAGSQSGSQSGSGKAA
jgi:hypothetical protein